MQNLSNKNILNLPVTDDAFWQRALKKENFAHAYCFYGAGMEKHKTAVRLAQMVNCEQRDACGQCRPCRLITSGDFPELHYVKADGASIKIEQIRELKSMVLYEPEQNVTRVVIIEQAQSMTLAAANSLLKLLEEAPPRLLLILLVENQYQILPTLLSRCQRIPFITPTAPFATTSAVSDISSISATSTPPTPDTPSILNVFSVPTSKDQPYAALLSQLTYDGYRLCAELSAIELHEHCLWVTKWSALIISSAHTAPGFLTEKSIHKLVLLKEEWLILDLLLLWWRELLGELLGRDEYFFPAAMSSERKKQIKQTNIVKILKGLMLMLEYRNKLEGSIQPQFSLEYMTLAIQEDLK